MIDIKKYLVALNIDFSWESVLKKYLFAYNIVKQAMKAIIIEGLRRVSNINLKC